MATAKKTSAVKTAAPAKKATAAAKKTTAPAAAAPADVATPATVPVKTKAPRKSRAAAPSSDNVLKALPPATPIKKTAAKKAAAKKTAPTGPVAKTTLSPQSPWPFPTGDKP
ncbi:MAG: hypothetical protein AB3X41_10875 [Leptothrix ochracea]|uniref:hypothetical protein n=1 Tax=Leptothrix ochracea TaxID=735331 RepID=UPI0034E25F67